MKNKKDVINIEQELKIYKSIYTDLILNSDTSKKQLNQAEKANRHYLKYLQILEDYLLFLEENQQKLLAIKNKNGKQELLEKVSEKKEILKDVLERVSFCTHCQCVSCAKICKMRSCSFCQNKESVAFCNLKIIFVKIYSDCLYMNVSAFVPSGAKYLKPLGYLRKKGSFFFIFEDSHKAIVIVSRQEFDHDHDHGRQHFLKIKNHALLEKIAYDYKTIIAILNGTKVALDLGFPGKTKDDSDSASSVNHCNFAGY